PVPGDGWRPGSVDWLGRTASQQNGARKDRADLLRHHPRASRNQPGDMTPPSRGWRVSVRSVLMAALGVAALTGIGRTALGVSHGLVAEYFSNPDRTAPTAFTGVDSEPSTSALSRRWRDAPPET